MDCERDPALEEEAQVEELLVSTVSPAIEDESPKTIVLRRVSGGEHLVVNLCVICKLRMQTAKSLITNLDSYCA